MCTLPNKLIFYFVISVVSAILSAMLGMNALFGLIQMSMSHLFRLDIPFLLQLQSFCYAVLKSLHHFMNCILPCYLGTKKISQHNIQNWKRTRQQVGRSSKYYIVTETYFYLNQPKREASRTESLFGLQRALHVLHISISCTPFVSRILNVHE